MEHTLAYPVVHPVDDSIKTKDQPECKELIIDIPLAPEARKPGKYCIYKVPKRLREVNNMAYTPRLVSIGPFHHRSDELKDMDIQKLLILRGFCDRTKKSIEELKCIIQPKEMEIRSCYSETFLLSSERFLNMILLDAIFILELFLRKYDKQYSRSSKLAHDDHIDYILSRPCMERGIQLDLLLLENQLPFFVLEKFYSVDQQNVVGNQNGEPKTKGQTLLELSCWFFGDLFNKYYYWPQSKPNKCFTGLVGCCHPQDPSSSSPKQLFISYLVKYFHPDEQNPSSVEPKRKVKHFTDLVRYFFCPPKTEEQKSEPKCCMSTSFSCPPNQKQEQQGEHKSIKHLYGTATKLDEAGLKFTKPDSKTYLLDIKFQPNKCLEKFPCFNLSWLFSCLPCLKGNCFERHVQRFLEVPPLWVDDKTEGLLRNLMALEQCHYPFETYVCDYIVLLDDLITMKADVRLLVEKKIIINELGSSAAVTKLINTLALEIELKRENYHYSELCKDLNEYYENNWNRLVGTLTRVYFSDFFKGTATIVGIIVLGFTLWNFNRLLGWSKH